MNSQIRQPDSFPSALWGVITHPLSTLKAVALDPRGVKWGAMSVALLCLLYTLTVAGLYGIGVGATAEPWLRIPAEQYYFWEIFLVFPVYFGTWILGAGSLQLLSRLWGGRGSFESGLAVLGFVVTIPWYLTWVVETTGLVLIAGGVFTLEQWQVTMGETTLGQAFVIGYQLIAMLWQLALMPIAVHTSQGLSAMRSSVLGLVVLVMVGLTAFVFIR